MELELADPLLLYDLLDSISQPEVDSDTLEDNAWRGEQSEGNNLVKAAGIQTHLIELPPSPLNYMAFRVSRTGSYYFSSISVAPHDSHFFDNTSCFLRSDFDDGKYSFLHSSKDGTGVLYDLSSEPFMSVIDSGDDGSTRTLQFGFAGAQPRRFGDSITFSKELTTFVGVSQQYLNTCLNAWVTRTGKPESLDFKLYIHL